MDDSSPWWLWPNLLSLDAPAVAVVWQSFLADTEGVEVPSAAIVALALTVWGLYLLDRWLDVRRGGHGDTDRHRFTARNPQILATLAALILPAALAIAWLGLPNQYLAVGGLVAIFSITYFAMVHFLQSSRAGFKGLKEASVGAVFAIGVAIPLIVATSQASQEGVFGVIAFGGLCVLNCILISRWEETPSTAPSNWTVLAACAIAAVASYGAKSAVTAAVLASLVLLIGLILLRSRISIRGLRVLADAALLTPLFVAALP